ncbi:MAG: DUF2079 domain-containing protein [Oscillospiraceae bacterium]|jgi:uncharacterized membrane protein|nr:DUF2079 domain-containing protein [Oscillospiraceae bacterium]
MKLSYVLKKIYVKSEFWRKTFIVNFFICWFMVSGLFILSRNSETIDVNFMRDSNLVFILFPIFFGTICFSLIEWLFEELPIARISLLISFCSFSVVLLIVNSSMYTYFTLLIILFLVIHYADFGGKGGLSSLRFKFPRKTIYALTALLALFFAFITGTVSVLRYLTYSAPNFDFGLFCNMFYHMKTEFVPYISSERDMLLSHFAVHISPIFYLLLPFYMIFPSPVTLAVGQVVILYSGIIPLLLLAKKRGLSRRVMVLLSIAYAAYPPLSAGTLYDIHENCFLVPLLLWMFCFYERKKTVPFAIFALLVCLVKEDAFIYVAIFAVYLIFAKKENKKGAIMLSSCLLYFAFASLMLANYGEGVMSHRYSNLLVGDEGLLGAVKTILINPGFTIGEIFKTNNLDSEKLFYFAQMMLPLALIPFISRKFTRYILIVPILINLITQYGYQFNTHFQYSFGITAYLFYITVLNLSELKPKRQFSLSLTAAISSCFLFIVIMIPKYTHYTDAYSANYEQYAQLNSILSEIPKDASVTASGFFVARLSDRHEVYEIAYHPTPSTEYLVLDMRGSASETSKTYAEQYIAAGYKLVLHESDLIAIYRKK